MAGIIKKDLTNQQFGRLKVIERDMTKIGHKCGSFWICLCECGVLKSIKLHSLITLETKSCGCLQRDISIQSALVDGGALKNSWIKKYIFRAKKLNISFELTVEEFFKICSMECYYCG
jgi:hypothetical protein